MARNHKSGSFPTLGAVAVYALYKALLTALRSEGMVRRSELDRPEQFRLICQSILAGIEEGVAAGLFLALLLLVFPWLSMPLGVVSLLGLGRATMELPRAFWEGLDDRQKDELHAAAYVAGVNLHRLLNVQGRASLQA